MQLTLVVIVTVRYLFDGREELAAYSPVSPKV